MRNTKKTTKSRVKFFLPKWEKGKGLKGFENTNKVSAGTVLINGLLFTCILLSLSSGIVDIVCYSGISVSYFHLGTWPIAAALLYTAISVGLISGKFWCAMKIGMLKELRTQLHTSNFSWAKNITGAIVPWQVAHKALIAISLITAMSMSVNSVGAGIRKMQQNINNMTNDATMLIELNNSVNAGIKDKRESAKSSITSNITARDDAKQEVDRYYSKLVQYQEEYFALPEDDEEGRQKVINKIVREIPGATARNAVYFTKADLQKSIQNVASKNEAVEDAKIYEEAVEYDKTQIEDTLNAIVDKEYRLPNGDLIKFVNEDGTLVNVQLAISRLQMGISEWQNDTGDVGESSKVFTLLATYMKADTKAGGMGAAEWMLMAFIFFSGIIQEFLIALCTPSATIERATLKTTARYLQFKDKFARENFLLDVYDNYLGLGVMSQEEYDYKCKKCYEIMGEDRESQRKRLLGIKTETVEKPKATKSKIEITQSEGELEPKVEEKPVEVKIEEKPTNPFKGDKIGDLIDEVDTILENK